MLRVRSKTGKTIVVEEPLEYVEILDGSDNVAMVFYKESILGSEAINIITPDMDEDAESYSKMYNVKWTEEIQGNWPKPEPVEINISK